MLNKTSARTELQSLDMNIKSIELVRKLTEIPSFEMTHNNEAVLTIDQEILPRLQEIFTAFSESSDDIKNLVTHCSLRPDSENKELTQFVIPNIGAHYLTFQKFQPIISTILSKKFDHNYKRLIINLRLIKTFVDKAIEAHKKQSIAEMNDLIARLDSMVGMGFNLFSDILFSSGLSLEQKNFSKNLFNEFVSWIRPEYFKELVSLDSESIINNYFSHIFRHLFKMRRTNYLLKAYLKFSNYFEISKLILEQACGVYFNMLNNNLFEKILGEIMILEYRELIDEIMPKGPAKQESLLQFHELLFCYSIKTINTPQTLFHYRFLTSNKNINYLLSSVKKQDCSRADKFFLSVGFGSLGMWNRLLKMNNLPNHEIFSEAGKFLFHLEKYKSIRSKLNIFSESVSFENNSYFDTLLIKYEALVAQETKPDYKKIPRKKKTPQQPAKPNTTILSYLDEKTLPLTDFKKPPNPLLPPPPPLPTLHKPQDECDADKRLKTKKYRESQRKEHKTQQTFAPPPKPGEKVYEINSKLGHLIYGALCLPPETSPAIIETATRILEKGRLGVKNNQVKFVTKDEIKKRGLPENAHYKLKGEILRGEEKGQLMRIYGIPNNSNIVNFSILVHKPHKTDGLEKNKLLESVI